MARVESDTERIARLHVPDDEHVPDEVKELWAKPLERLGFVPNVLRIFALRPQHLLAWWAHYDELLRGESGLTYAQLDRRERAMLDFAVKLTQASDQCTEDDVEALREAGWTDEDIFDIAEVAAMFNFTNRLASAFGWLPNPEYFTLGR